MEALDFFEGLEADNSKAYWTANKAVYDEMVYAPMRDLLADLAPDFGPGKIFRPYRDVRFSADKSPYKTTIAASLERGGYVQLSAQGLGAGTGMYQMTPEQLQRYRQAVEREAPGEELRRLIEALARDKIVVTGHEQLKTVPRGYPRDHARADLLRHKGLVAWREWPVAAWLGRPAAKQRVVEFLRLGAPLNRWLDTNVGSP
jgi:uncharacterized protein (TIGR02453 family)